MFLNSSVCLNKKKMILKNQIKSNQINFIGIKSSHRTVTSHMHTIAQLHVQLQSQIDPYTTVFLYKLNYLEEPLLQCNKIETISQNSFFLIDFNARLKLRFM